MLDMNNAPVGEVGPFRVAVEVDWAALGRDLGRRNSADQGDFLEAFLLALAKHPLQPLWLAEYLETCPGFSGAREVIDWIARYWLRPEDNK